MSNLDKNHIIKILSALGEQLNNPNEELVSAIENEQYHNAWFTPASVMQAIKAIGQMLNANDLSQWLQPYQFTNQQKKVGLILAGNIPLVGFHDVLCVLVSGNFALIKASSQDARLIKYLLNLLGQLDDHFTNQYRFVERLENFDAIIATGSNNTSRYFEYYFGKVPNIIRKNRNSVAVLTGVETTAQLHALGHDIFDYYGLGCRNVSKLMVPPNYDFVPFFEAIESYNAIIHHHKYNNNYDYNKSIYLVNRDKHLDNGFLVVKGDDRMVSPLAVLFYQEYADEAKLLEYLQSESEKIQCVVSSHPLNISNQVVGFGQSQHPQLCDYADNADTLQFLVNL